jgi:predicted metal-dependent hydrolase
MNERGEVRFGTTAIQYTITRSHRRRKTVAITLDPYEGVLVAAPATTPAAQIDAIVAKRARWIVRQQTAAPPAGSRRTFASGESLPYLGQQLRLFVEQGDGRRPGVELRQWSIHLLLPPGLAGETRWTASEQAIVRWYKAQAVDWLSTCVARWAARAGYGPRAVLVRAQRQRWGSCSTDGTLRFNWRILMAPPTLIDYVVVHELVHLRLKHHAAGFWAEVARLMPDYQLRRGRLKELGPRLSL